MVAQLGVPSLIALSGNGEFDPENCVCVPRNPVKIERHSRITQLSLVCAPVPPTCWSLHDPSGPGPCPLHHVQIRSFFYLLSKQNFSTILRSRVQLTGKEWRQSK